MASGTGQRFAFLYQSEQGRVDAATWMRAAAPLAAIFTATTLIWIAIKPYAARGLDERRFFDPVTLAVNLYLILYGIVAILLVISWVNLTAKRFRDRGRAPPVGLAGVLPLLTVLDGALRWLQPQIADVLPRPWVYAGDAAVLVALAWTVADCVGWTPRRTGQNP